MSLAHLSSCWQNASGFWFQDGSRRSLHSSAARLPHAISGTDDMLIGPCCGGAGRCWREECHISTSNAEKHVGSCAMYVDDPWHGAQSSHGNLVVPRIQSFDHQHLQAMPHVTRWSDTGQWLQPSWSSDPLGRHKAGTIDRLKLLHCVSLYAHMRAPPPLRLSISISLGVLNCGKRMHPWASHCRDHISLFVLLQMTKKGIVWVSIRLSS